MKSIRIEKILNELAYEKLWIEIQNMKDREEAAVRNALLDEIDNSITAFNKHVIEYEYQRYCKAIVDRGLRFRVVDKAEVVKLWDEFFAADVSGETRHKIHYYTGFRWHAFSYGKIPARTEAAARRAFDRCKKGAAYLFIEDTDEAWFIENAHLLKAKDLDADYYFEREDIHVFDVNGKWAYAKTHESDCGPYFLRKNK